MEFSYGTTLSTEVINEFENSHSVRLPKSYIDVVKNNDGASLTPHLCRVIDPFDGKPMVIGLGSLIPFRRDDSDGFTMESANDGSIEGLPREVIAFGMEAGGIMFAFDYRMKPETDDPPIVCHFGEYPDELAIFPAAVNFSEFMRSLFSDENDHETDIPTV